MRNYLCVNDLIKWKNESEENNIERVLWIDQDNIHAFVIHIFKKQCVPELKRVNDILYALDNDLAEKLKEDPWITYKADTQIDQKRIGLRDEAWNIISQIVDYKNEPDIYNRNFRRRLILDASKQFNKSDRVIYKYLTKFWQRGKLKNALLPDYDNSGGKGKSKTPGEKKIGRPRKNAAELGKGINVDEATKRIFRIAISNHYDTQKENPLTHAYDMMLKEHYAEDYRIEAGIRKPIIVHIGDIPTIDQFRYWYEKENNIIESLKKRKGSKKYALENRAVLGKSDADLMGPGSVFQIDATVADVYLVSRHNRDWIIGRPVIYVVIDAFCREVVGLYVGLEGPSWMGAMMALANAFTDKVRYCKEYGIDIDEEEWPCHHLPQAILGDRGELEGKMPEPMITSLGIRISNTPSYRADWKGIVEQYFRLLDIKVKPFVPGHIDVDFRQRGGKDYRTDAKLDISQFTKIIIKCILYYNNKHWMDEYEADEMMITDDINPIPRDLWNWGIEKRSGRLRSHHGDIIKLNIMPSAKATIRENGIKFKNMRYSCEKAINEMWFERARNKGSWKVDIAYDPRNMDYIYIRSKDARTFEKCYMLDKRRYSEKTLEEIEYLDAYDQLKKDKNKGEQIQSKIDLLSDIEAIVSDAERMTNEQQDPTISKASKVKGIRDKRYREKLENRKLEALELDKNEEKDSVEVADVITINKDLSEDLSFPSNIEFLRRKQRERMAKKNED